jgi:hypothetical protein
VLSDTNHVAQLISSSILSGCYNRTPVEALNTPNDQIFVDKLGVIRDNQMKGERGFSSRSNYVVKKPKYSTDQVKKDIVVGVAPVGPCRNY